MILTTVKIGEDPALDPGPPLHVAAMDGAIITKQADIDARRHIPDLHHPRSDEGHLHMTPRGDVLATNVVLLHLPTHHLHLDLVRHPHPDPRHGLHRHHEIIEGKSEKIALDPTLRSEVTDAVEETGTNEHLLTPVEHMLMRTRPDVREAVPTIIPRAGVVHTAGRTIAPGAEAGAGTAITAKGAETEVEKGQGRKGSTRIGGSVT